MNCIFCDSDNTREVIKTWNIDYKGHSLDIENVHVVECLDCEKSAEGPKQGSHNELMIADAKRQHDKLLSSKEIIDIIQNHCINKSSASRYFGGGQNSFSKYTRGECIQSVAVDKLLRLSRDIPEVFPYLLALENGDKQTPKFLVMTTINEPFSVSGGWHDSPTSWISFNSDDPTLGHE